jgi:hypothetical protein
METTSDGHQGEGEGVSIHIDGVEDLAEEGKRQLRKTARQPWVKRLTRLGFAARGLIYFLVGYLAIQVALGGRGEITDQKGALASIASSDVGRIVLIVVAIGLAGYSFWYVLRAVLNTEQLEQNLKGKLTRGGYFLTAVVYAFTAVSALRVLGGDRTSTDAQAEAASASILSFAWGPWLVGLVGLALIGLGVGQFLNAFRPNFGHQFKNYTLSTGQQVWILRLGRFGTAARAAVMSITGALVVWSALTLDPEKAGGYDSALLTLAQQPYGTLLLAFVAFGLIAFGLYSLLGAAWFRIKTS